VQLTTPSFRPSIEADIPSEHQVFCRAEGGLRLRHGFAWVDPPLGWFAPIARHLLSSDPGRCFVAEVDGQVVGFSAAFVRDDTWFLAALFIHPDHQGKGIGRQLFELSARDAPSSRITITDAIQPVSNALYACYGLIPTAPLLMFEGEPSVDVPPVLEPDRPRPGELTMLDRAGYGFERTVDHDYWPRQRSCTVWRRDGAAVAYAYRALTGSIGPLVGLDQMDAADALRAELARARRASVVVPGTARSLVEVAVGAGLRLVSPPGLLLLSSKVQAPDRLAISNYFLY
jgi:GNAT superfamily N-acetyltransferase